jgi:uncharacterized alpha-E superfamily protein
VITPARVSELLLLNPDMPRSLRFCYDQVADLLNRLTDGRRLECERMAGEFSSRLRYARIEKVLAGGLHDFLMEVLDRNAELHGQISRDFMMVV